MNDSAFSLRVNFGGDELHFRKQFDLGNENIAAITDYDTLRGLENVEFNPGRTIRYHDAGVVTVIIDSKFDSYNCEYLSETS